MRREGNVRLDTAEIFQEGLRVRIKDAKNFREEVIECEENGKLVEENHGIC